MHSTKELATALSNHKIISNTWLTRFKVALLLTEGTWVFTGQILAAVGSLCLVAVLSRTLSPKTYGTLSLALTLAALVNQSIISAVVAAAGRYYSVCAPQGNWRQYISCLGRLFTRSLVWVCAFSLLAIIFFLYYKRIPVVLITCALIISVVSGYNSTIGSIQTAARRRISSSLFSILDSWTKVGSCIVITWFFSEKELPILLGFLGASLLVAVLQSFWLKRANSGFSNLSLGVKDKDVNDTHLLKKMFQYSWPFNIWGFFSWIQQSSDRWSLEAFCSTAEVGIYSVIFQIAYLPMTMLGNIACIVAGPILFSHSSPSATLEKRTSARRLTWLISIALIVTSMLAALLGELLRHQISALITGPAYRNNVAVWLSPVILAGGIFAAGQFLSLGLMSEMHSRKILNVKVVTSLLGLTLNITGAYYFQLAGIVLGALIFSVVHYIFMAKAFFDSNNKFSAHSAKY